MWTHSVMEHTEQQRLEQLEHCRVQEEQAGRSHWEHGVLDPWLLWHTQQPAGAAAPPTQEAHNHKEGRKKSVTRAYKSETMLTSAGKKHELNYFWLLHCVLSQYDSTVAFFFFCTSMECAGIFFDVTHIVLSSAWNELWKKMARLKYRSLILFDVWISRKTVMWEFLTKL